MARIPVEHKREGFPWWGWILALALVAAAIWIIAEVVDTGGEEAEAETEVAVAEEEAYEPTQEETFEERAEAETEEFGAEVEQGAEQIGQEAQEFGEQAEAETEEAFGIEDEEMAQQQEGMMGQQEGIQQQKITELSRLQNPDNPDQLVANEVDLTNVMVESVIGDKTFLIQPLNAGGDAAQVLVKLTQAETPQAPTEGVVDINPGMTANVKGTVQKLDEQMMNELQLSEQDRQKLEGKELFIRATQVERVTQPAGT